MQLFSTFTLCKILAAVPIIENSPNSVLFKIVDELLTIVPLPIFTSFSILQDGSKIVGNLKFLFINFLIVSSLFFISSVKLHSQKIENKILEFDQICWIPVLIQRHDFIGMNFGRAVDSTQLLRQHHRSGKSFYL